MPLIATAARRSAPLAAAPAALAGPVNVVDRIRADAGEGVTLYSNDEAPDSEALDLTLVS